jgi:hypothetical protein
MKNTFKTALTLTFLIAILATLASAGGLFLQGLYRDNPLVVSAWKGNDWVTLLIMVPVLIAALRFVIRGSYRAQLIWMGALDYMLYNYAFYLFGAAFNWFFLIYTGLLGLSIFALIFGLAGIDVNAIAKRFRSGTPIKWVAGYMLLSAVGLSVVYLTQSIGFIFTEQVPPIVMRTGHPTSVVFALDLTLLIPVMILGAIWLLQRKPWGYVLAGISTVKGPAYTLVLTAGSLSAMSAGIPGTSAEIPIWVFLTVIGLMAGALLYGNIGSSCL